MYYKSFSRVSPIKGKNLREISLRSLEVKESLLTLFKCFFYTLVLTKQIMLTTHLLQHIRGVLMGGFLFKLCISSQGRCFLIVIWDKKTPATTTYVVLYSFEVGHAWDFRNISHLDPTSNWYRMINILTVKSTRFCNA